MADNAKVSLPSIQEWFPEHIRLKGSTPPMLITAHPYTPPQPIRISSPDDARSDPIRTSSSSLHNQPSPDDEDQETKRHICAICHKRFRRPSSLNIHINSHTGATSYLCPLPGCGKEFNVKSNMLRHYRSRTNPVPSSSSSSVFDVPTKNPRPQIHTSSDASFTEGQNQASSLLQSLQSRPWHESTGMGEERDYQHLYPMSSDSLTLNEEERMR